MPLSEHEERILAEIERRLSEDDPRFVERARRTSPVELRTRHLRWAVVGFVLGFVCLLGLTFHITLGLVGFGLMLVSVIVGVRAVLGADRGALGERFRDLFSRREDDHAG